MRGKERVQGRICFSRGRKTTGAGLGVVGVARLHHVSSQFYFFSTQASRYEAPGHFVGCLPSGLGIIQEASSAMKRSQARCESGLLMGSHGRKSRTEWVAICGKIWWMCWENAFKQFRFKGNLIVFISYALISNHLVFV